MAVESVLTFSLGLVVAIGVISLFGDYRDTVVNEAGDTQTQIVEKQIKDAVLELSYTSSTSEGYKQVELPNKIGNKDYQISADNHTLAVFVGREDHNTTINFLDENQELSGTVEGGNVRVYKRANEYTLQPRR